MHHVTGPLHQALGQVTVVIRPRTYIIIYKYTSMIRHTDDSGTTEDSLFTAVITNSNSELCEAGLVRMIV